MADSKDVSATSEPSIATAAMDPVPSLNAPPASERVRIYPFLDGLRGAAALYVVFHHALFETDPYRSRDSQLATWFDRLRLLHYGHSAVAVFIVLSGFLLMQPLVVKGHLPGGIWAFAKRRALRILPAYYVTLFVCLFIILCVPGMSEKGGWRWDYALPGITLKSILTHLTLTQVYLKHGWEIDPVMWSVSAEWFIYGLFAVALAPAFKKWGIAGLVMLSAIFTVLGLQVHTVPDFVWLYILLFAFGAWAATVTIRHAALLHQWRRAFFPTFLICFAAAVYCLLMYDAGHTICGPLGEIAVGVTSTVLVVWGCMVAQRGQKVWFLESRAILGVGTFSYSLYLVHWPTLSVLHSFLRSQNLAPTTILVILMTCGTSLALMIAYFWYLLFEAPFLKLKKRTSRA